MKSTLLIFICLLSHSLLGQTTVDGIIKNARTNELVPYVNIGILNKEKGTVSNEKGEFPLELRAESCRMKKPR